MKKNSYYPAFILTLFLSLSFPYIAHAGTDTPVPTIQVTGTGTANITPDMAVINLGVVRQGTNAREALTANNRAMKGVLAALKEQSIAPRDLQTSNFNIQPRYQYFKASSNGRQKPPKIVGYRVSNSLTVRIRDLEKLGDILDLVVTLGVNSGGNVQFTNDDPSAAIDEARKNAMLNAIAKAKILTGAAGVSLGDILSISENRSGGPRPVAMARAAFKAESGDSVPVAAGENSYRINVNVSWKIKQ